MLTPNTTNWILDNLRPDFVLNGHDHEGCDTLHVSTSLSTSDSASDSNTSPLSWTAYSTATFSTASIDKNTKVVREITQRSMMAEFGGYSGLFEIRVNPDYHHQGSEKKNEDDDDYLEFSYQSCAFYKDLFVWIVIVTDLIVATAWTLVGSIWAVLYFVRHASSSRTAQKTISPKEKIL
ncbi:hypothetical protein BG004_003791 [Podila humilis]|nr:hypothetical protein BG004_003791 [Podila humilis]